MKMKNKRTLNEQERFTMEGVCQFYESKIGFRETMKLTPIIYLHHLISRGICKENEEQMKSFLLQEGYSTTEIMKVLKRYNDYKKNLPEYNWKIQRRMDKIQQMYDPKTIASWEQVDNRHLGIVKEDEGYKVIDIAQGNERVIAMINEGIYWLTNNLTPKQMSYIKENAKILKTPMKGVLV